MTRGFKERYGRVRWSENGRNKDNFMQILLKGEKRDQTKLLSKILPDLNDVKGTISNSPLNLLLNYFR